MAQTHIVTVIVSSGLAGVAAAWAYSKLRPADPGEPAHLLPATWRSFAVNHPWCVLPCHGSCAIAHVLLALAHVSGLIAVASILLSALRTDDEPFLMYLFVLLPSLLMTPITHSLLARGLWKYSIDFSAKQRFVDPKESPPVTSSSSSGSVGWGSPGHLDYLFKDLDSTILQAADGVALDPQEPQDQPEPEAERSSSSAARADTSTPRCTPPVSQFFSEDAQGFVFAVEDDVDAEDMSIGALSTSLGDDDAADEGFQKEYLPCLSDEIDNEPLLTGRPGALFVDTPTKEGYSPATREHQTVIASELVSLSAARHLSWLARRDDHADITLPDVNFLSIESHDIPAAIPSKARTRRYIAPVHSAAHRRKACAACSIFAIVALALVLVTAPYLTAADLFPGFLAAVLSIDVVVVQPVAVALAVGFHWLTAEPGEPVSRDLHPIDGQWRLIPSWLEHEVDIASDFSG